MSHKTATTLTKLLYHLRRFNELTGETLFWEWGDPSACSNDIALYFLPNYPEHSEARIRKALRMRHPDWVNLHKHITIARLNGVIVKGWP